jgi:hypothetical protein
MQHILWKVYAQFFDTKVRELTLEIGGAGYVNIIIRYCYTYCDRCNRLFSQIIGRVRLGIQGEET